MTTHTPGPWEATLGNEETNGAWEGFTFDEIHSADGDLVALAVPMRARLITAAPELLKALKAILLCIHRDGAGADTYYVSGFVNAAVKRANSVIAQAERGRP